MDILFEKDGLYFYLGVSLENNREVVRVKLSRREGFQGERLLVLPPKIRYQLLADPVCRELYFTDIGLFPSASNHYVERHEGCGEYVLQFCFDGSGFCKYNGKEFAVHANQYFILPPGEKHVYGTPTGQEWKVGWIHFLGEGAGKFVDRINSKGFGVPHEISFSRSWIKNFNDMIDALKYDLGYSNVAYNCCKLWPLMAELIFKGRLHISSEGTSPVDKAVNFMQENIHNHVSLSEIASIAGLSVSRFSVLFREKTGVSPKEYHIGLKIQKACSYLSMTDLSVKEIAKELSFDDPYYFSRCFKQRMDVSPVHFRRSNIL